MGSWYVTFKTRGGGFGYSGPFVTRWGARRIAKKWRKPKYGCQKVRVVSTSGLFDKAR